MQRAAAVTLASAVAIALLVAVATAQSFPFTDGPLEASNHSNKVFFNVTDVKEVAGVWKGLNLVFQSYLASANFLYDGVSPFNTTCAAVTEAGWNYDFMLTNPRAMTIEFDPERLEDGVLGYYVATEYGTNVRHAIVDYVDNKLMMNDGYCMPMRPYLDWELGKTMLVRNYRIYYFASDDGTTAFHEDLCDHDGEDHPTCEEGTFMVDGVEREAVLLDSVFFFECIAGPCLDLPHTIPEFVQTQGYVPAFRQEITADAGR